MKIYSFGLGVNSDETSPEVLGGKGAGLAWMDKQGIPVPPGFIIPTDVCVEYMQKPKTVMKEVTKTIGPWMSQLKLKFGYRPLVSVRSGARVSMPGMMDTILNVGLDVDNAQEWVNRIGASCVADSRRRLIEMYASVVQGLPRENFVGLTPEQAVDAYIAMTGEQNFPDANGQLIGSIEAVFRSWNNERAKTYRKLNNIPDNWGTAVVVQAMVFGNMNDKSATGVLFTRNPDSGEDAIKGEFLVNAQGEDVVAGTSTPSPLHKLPEWNPEIAKELIEIVTNLEELKGEVQDVEFTIQDGKLFILQTRKAKTSARAAIRIALEMLDSELITIDDVFKRVSYKDYLRAGAHVIAPDFKVKPTWVGIPACSGLAMGEVVLTAAEAVASKKPVILVSKETTPEDIAGMHAARGVLTMTGGATSHAAVVARGMNRACIVGLGADLSQFVTGMKISIDGATGRVWKGEIPIVPGGLDVHFNRLNTLLAEKAHVGIIDEKDADVLDVSDLSTAAAIVAINNALKTRESVIVDTRKDMSPARDRFNAMFGAIDVTEPVKVKTICDACAYTKIKFITNVKREELGPYAATVQLIAQVKTAEEMVLAEGDFMLDASGPWVSKLLHWKTSLEKSKILRLGAVEEGAYASRIQLAHAFLRR